MNPIQFLSQEMMIPILTSFYSVTHSYGWAIILLTVTIKLALFPLTAKQFRATRQLQAIQPKMQALQAQHKDNPQELQAKMMELYKEHNANPFGSCLPTLIQLPFLFALYSALGNPEFQARIANTSFLFLHNLAAKGVLPGVDPVTHQQHGILWDNLVLVLFFGASTWAMQKLMTTNPQDPTQQQMLTMMPLMMTVMFVFFPLPSGILLYIAVSNLISIGQNLVLMRGMPAVAPAGVPASKAVIDTTPTVVQDEKESPGKGNKRIPPETGKKGN